jgi:hypothetical protein
MNRENIRDTLTVAVWAFVAGAAFCAGEVAVSVLIRLVLL